MSHGNQSYYHFSVTECKIYFDQGCKFEFVCCQRKLINLDHEWTLEGPFRQGSWKNVLCITIYLTWLSLRLDQGHAIFYWNVLSWNNALWFMFYQLLNLNLFAFRPRFMRHSVMLNVLPSTWPDYLCLWTMGMLFSDGTFCHETIFYVVVTFLSYHAFYKHCSLLGWRMQNSTWIFRKPARIFLIIQSRGILFLLSSLDWHWRSYKLHKQERVLNSSGVEKIYTPTN